ncbi:MAG: glycosyltransferase [Rhizobiales bacterium]|nr:glycosyltransferase [Hyphomicrobiales bacterium]MBI3673482.1 glycosyltransferase [Hyphomicrobiales bacterium]
MSTTITSLLILFCVGTTAVHLLSVLAVALRMRHGEPAAGNFPLPAVTIVRPISGADPYLHDTLKSSFELEARNVEIIFCAAYAGDPAVEVTRRLIDAHPEVDARLLIGDDRIGRNPKLNNCAKGWWAGRNDFTVFIDSNVMLTPDYLGRMFEVWNAETGLVSSPPIGDRPGNFWACVECDFLNTYQARWLLFADQFGIGFAHGKNLLFRKSILEPIGGIEALGQEPAEDAAATKAIRAIGLKVRLTRHPFAQPLGRRKLSELWRRQVRWARLRRATFPLLYLPEIFAGSLLPTAAGVAVAWRLGFDLLATGGSLFLLWVASELILAKCMRWHVSFESTVGMIARDLLIPAIWVAGFVSNGFVWQGHEMSAERETTEVQTG